MWEDAKTLGGLILFFAAILIPLYLIVQFVKWSWEH